MTSPRVEKAYEKYAWILLLLNGILGIAPTFFNLVAPTVATLETFLTGLFLLVFTIATIGISVTSYRNGKRWSWFALWYVPVFDAVGAYMAYSAGYPIEQNGLVPAVGLSIVGLVLPYRKFFPKR